MTFKNVLTLKSRSLNEMAPHEFHCDYGHILYRFRDESRYWQKIAIFHAPCT